jgi:hypothetical protein
MRSRLWQNRLRKLTAVNVRSEMVAMAGGTACVSWRQIAWKTTQYRENRVISGKCPSRRSSASCYRRKADGGRLVRCWLSEAGVRQVRTGSGSDRVLQPMIAEARTWRFRLSDLGFAFCRSPHEVRAKGSTLKWISFRIISCISCDFVVPGFFLTTKNTNEHENRTKS